MKKMKKMKRKEKKRKGLVDFSDFIEKEAAQEFVENKSTISGMLRV